MKTRPEMTFTRGLPYGRNLWSLGLASMMLLGILVRVVAMSHPMRYDESYTYLHFVSKSPGLVVSTFMPNNHILHSLMAWLSCKCLGSSPPALRLSAFLGGLLLLPATAYLTWLISRHRLAVALSLLTAACSSALIEYSTSARGYSWLALLAATQLICMIRTCLSDHPAFWQGGWAICGALGAYTVPVVMVWTLATLVVGIITNANAKSRKSWLVAGGGWLLIVGLLYLPTVLPHGMTTFVEAKTISYRALSSELPDSWSVMSSVWGLWLRHAPLPWAFLSLLGAILAVILSCGQQFTGLRITLWSIAISVAILVASQAPLPARTWLFLWPAAIAIICTGLVHGLEGVAAAIKTPMLRRFISCGAIIAIGFLPVAPVKNVLSGESLCSEPGGLVRVEPAVEICRRLGPEHCGIVSRYTPATTYYLRHYGLPDLPIPGTPDCDHVIVVAESEADLDRLITFGADPSTCDPAPIHQEQGTRYYHCQRQLLSRTHPAGRSDRVTAKTIYGQ